MSVICGIFVHIDKCCGVSVRTIVERYPHLVWMHADHIMAVQPFPLPPRRVGKISPQVWSQSFKWTFVRNPWDRLVSLWRMVETRQIHQSLQGKRSLADIVRIAETPGLEEWEIPDIETALAADPEWHRSDDLIKMHLLPYRHPTFHLDKVDFIGRFEDLNHDWKYIRRQIGIRDRLPKLNATRHRHYAHYYDDELRERVARVYHQDLQRFQYRFEIPHVSPLRRVVQSILFRR